MNGQEKSNGLLKQEIEDLRRRLEEAEDALNAIRNGEVDALVVSSGPDDQVYILQGADHAYRVMVESINEGAAALQEDGMILYCNKRLAEMLGQPLEKVLGSYLPDHLAPSERETFEALARKSLQKDGREEFNLCRGDESRIPVVLSMSPADIELQRGLCLIATDLSEQKRNEEIASAERMARSILEQAAEAIIVCDLSGTIIRASQATHQMLKQNPLYRPFEEMFSITFEGVQQDPKPFSIHDVLAGHSFNGSDARLEIPPVDECSQDRRSLFVLLSATPLRNERGDLLGCIVTLTDITQRKQAETILREREMQYRLMDQREQERIQIARNLHDGPLQDLLSLSYTVQAMVTTPQDQNMNGSLTEIRASLVALAGELRNVCNELRPPILARFGLAKAIHAHSEEFQARYPHLKLNFTLEDDAQMLSDGMRMGLFRIYQECLNNIIHHADATAVTVELTLESNLVHMEIHDDGKGFRAPNDWIELVRDGHLGLVGMKERAEALGGKIQVHSQPDRGTTIIVEIPRVASKI